MRTAQRWYRRCTWQGARTTRWKKVKSVATAALRRPLCICREPGIVLKVRSVTSACIVSFLFVTVSKFWAKVFGGVLLFACLLRFPRPSWCSCNFIALHCLETKIHRAETLPTAVYCFINEANNVQTPFLDIKWRGLHGVTSKQCAFFSSKQFRNGQPVCNCIYNKMSNDY